MVDVPFTVALSDVADYVNSFALWDNMLLIPLLLLGFCLFILYTRFVENDRECLCFLSSWAAVCIGVVVVFFWFGLWYYFSLQMDFWAVNAINDQCVRTCFPMAYKVAFFKDGSCVIYGSVCQNVPDRVLLNFCKQKCRSFENDLRV